MIKKKYSIKKIKKNYYVYTWRYIKKGNRKNEKKRFDWFYQGPLDGKGGEYINKQLDAIQKTAAWQDVEFIKVKEKELIRIEQELISRTTYSRKMSEVDSIVCEDERKCRMKLINNEIEMEAKGLVNIMFKQFDSERYHEFLLDGGTLDELRERIHI